MFQTKYLDIPPLVAAGGDVTLPGSKSISNRVLLLAALCKGCTTLTGLLNSDDTRVMLAALHTLGCRMERDGDRATVHGLDGELPCQEAGLFLGNAGTAVRPLTAALAVLGGDFQLRGVQRMHERPIGDLVDGLRQLGCQLDYLDKEGYPPLRIREPQWSAASNIQVRGDVSSQFLSALLMVLPLLQRQRPAATPLTIEVMGELISKPYVEITLNLLARFGVTVQREGWRRFWVLPGAALRSPGALQIEADASSASYFIALGALSTPRDGHSAITIHGVGADSIQGDIRFIEAAQSMGALVESGSDWIAVRRGAWPLRALDLDCNHIPDAAMTLAIMALFADGPSTLRNIGSWRVKETDRLAAMACELRKLGAEVQEGPDWIRVTPPAPQGWRAASIRTYDDHRMAMCCALTAFNPAQLPVRILEPQCVAKTFPDYFETLFGLVQPREVPVLCIDGPTASGKGTLAAAIAKRLGYQLLDSGALYRVVALAALQRGMQPDAASVDALAALATGLTLQFESGCVLLDGVDVTEAIRTESVGMAASQVSALPPVRAALLARQRAFASLPGLVADGRDMGTVVFPEAALKVYLTATPEARARRRHQQLLAKGVEVTIEGLAADLQARDARDSARAIAPLKPAQDAKLLDNSQMSVEASVDLVENWWRARPPFDPG